MYTASVRLWTCEAHTADPLRAMGFHIISPDRIRVQYTYTNQSPHPYPGPERTGPLRLVEVSAVQPGVPYLCVFSREY